MTVHKKVMMLMQTELEILWGKKLIPPGWQCEQACSFCQALFNRAINVIYEGFYQVVLDFIWIV
jgi:hypothetical protein